jgi:hypothetical protein
MEPSGHLSGRGIQISSMSISGFRMALTTTMWSTFLLYFPIREMTLRNVVSLPPGTEISAQYVCSYPVMTSCALYHVDLSGLHCTWFTHIEVVSLSYSCRAFQQWRAEKVLLNTINVLSPAMALLQWFRSWLFIASALGNGSAPHTVNGSAENLPWHHVTRLCISRAGAGAGVAGRTWLDFLIAAAERRAQWYSHQRRWLSAMICEMPAECMAVWSSWRRCRLWVWSPSSSPAIGMWNLTLLPICIGGLPICIGWLHWSGSSLASIPSTHSSSSGNSHMSITLR